MSGVGDMACTKVGQTDGQMEKIETYIPPLHGEYLNEVTKTLFGLFTVYRWHVREKHKSVSGNVSKTTFSVNSFT